MTCPAVVLCCSDLSHYIGILTASISNVAFGIYNHLAKLFQEAWLKETVIIKLMGMQYISPAFMMV